MHPVFISYRRKDSKHAAVRLKDSLEKRLGSNVVFADVSAIEPGEDFYNAIMKTIQNCKVIIALIGENWLNARDESGTRRLDDPEDLVRIEIKSGLEQGIPVIPVRLDGTPMPSAEELPGELKPLARLNSPELAHESWETDVERLIGRIKLLLGDTKPFKAEQPASTKKVIPFLAAAALLLPLFHQLYEDRQDPIKHPQNPTSNPSNNKVFTWPDQGRDTNTYPRDNPAIPPPANPPQPPIKPPNQTTTSQKPAETGPKVTLAYYPKFNDPVSIKESLQSLPGYNLNIAEPSPGVSAIPTNAIWYGQNVPEESIRKVALALTKSGIAIKKIGPITISKNLKANTIEVGSSGKSINRPPLNQEEIRTAPLPMGGD